MDAGRQAARGATASGLSLACMRRLAIVSRFDAGSRERHSWQTCR
jgi:hypothetical protein